VQDKSTSGFAPDPDCKCRAKNFSAPERTPAKKMNISVVVDDDRKVIGLVSIEDILEELVGEIFDEYDIEK